MDALQVKPGGTYADGTLGGGGHAAAGGCTVEGTVDEAKEAILKALDTVWER